jgi:hypothetical protein
LTILIFSKEITATEDQLQQQTSQEKDDSNDGVGSKREPHERNTKKDGDYGRWSICKGSSQSS